MEAASFLHLLMYIYASATRTHTHAHTQREAHTHARTRPCACVCVRVEAPPGASAYLSHSPRTVRWRPRSKLEQPAGGKASASPRSKHQSGRSEPSCRSPHVQHMRRKIASTWLIMRIPTASTSKGCEGGIIGQKRSYSPLPPRGARVKSEEELSWKTRRYLSLCRLERHEQALLPLSLPVCFSC